MAANKTTTRPKRSAKPNGTAKLSSIVSSVGNSPLTAAVAVGSAVAAGMFLWSRRTRIGDEIIEVTHKVSDALELSMADGNRNEASLPRLAGKRRGRRTQAQIAEEALTLKQIGEVA